MSSILLTLRVHVAKGKRLRRFHESLLENSVFQLQVELYGDVHFTGNVCDDNSRNPKIHVVWLYQLFYLADAPMFVSK